MNEKGQLFALPLCATAVASLTEPVLNGCASSLDEWASVHTFISVCVALKYRQITVRRTFNHYKTREGKFKRGFFLCSFPLHDLLSMQTSSGIITIQY